MNRYELHRSTVDGFEPTPGADTRVFQSTSYFRNFFTSTGLSPCTTYYFVLVQVAIDGHWVKSNQRAAMTQCVPSAPCADDPEGTPCDDGNPCTQADVCDGAGTCTGSDPVPCTAADDCHDGGVCDPETGLCDYPVKPDGSACSDGNTCTLDDTCQAGACQPGGPTLLMPLADVDQTVQCIEQTATGVLP